MDLESIIIGAIFIAICILPFILTGRSRKNREKQIFQSLSNIANQHGCQINQHEICLDCGIGIDDTKNFVLFFKQTKDKVVEEFIDLAEIQNCKVCSTTRTIKSKEGNYKVIDKLELVFTPRIENKSAVTLEFFNTDICMQLYGELQSIEKWSKLIKDRLKISV